MRLGILAYSTHSGLGYQSRSYVKHLNPVKILDIDITRLNGMNHYEWYPEARVTKGYPSIEDCHWITDNVDVVLMAETPLNYELYKIARDKGVKTVNVINPEFYDHIKYPQYDMPDLIILPSVWLQNEITAHATSRMTKVVQLHHPVDLEEFPFTERSSHRFMHIAGKPATHDRNGTWDFLNACSDGIVTTQSEEMARMIRRRYRNTRVMTNIESPQDIYRYGDVLVMPRKYGGNCLPLNEALASGMPVIMPDIIPNNNLLPPEWLVPAYISDSFTPRTKVDIWTTDHKALVERIEWIKSQDIKKLSQQASNIADTISWKTLLPKYMEALESL